MNPLLETPLTDELHEELTGDWEFCYDDMRRHATRMEQQYNVANARVQELEAQVAKATTGPTIPSAYLEHIKLGDLHRILQLGLSTEETRRINVE